MNIKAQIGEFNKFLKKANKTGKLELVSHCFQFKIPKKRHKKRKLFCKWHKRSNYWKDKAAKIGRLLLTRKGGE